MYLPLEHLFASFRIRPHSDKLSFSVTITGLEGGVGVFCDVMGRVLDPESVWGSAAHSYFCHLILMALSEP